MSVPNGQADSCRRSCFMRSVHGAVQGRDTSVRGIISKACFIQGAQHPRTFGRGHIGRGHINPASRELGIETPEHIKHLGLYLGKNIQDTVTETMRQIDPKALKRRIFATTPPTDLLHRALLLNTAYIPMYNHVFMALPTLINQGDALQKEVLSFLWT